jgi:hypothetical protein
MAQDIFQLLEQVRDRESFIAFARALADERGRAEQLERTEPDRYSTGGALDWQNGDIASFIHAGLEYFSPGPNRFEGDQPAWKDFAIFLWFGKIYE